MYLSNTVNRIFILGDFLTQNSFVNAIFARPLVTAAIGQKIVIMR